MTSSNQDPTPQAQPADLAQALLEQLTGQPQSMEARIARCEAGAPMDKEIQATLADLMIERWRAGTLPAAGEDVLRELLIGLLRQVAREQGTIMARGGLTAQALAGFDEAEAELRQYPMDKLIAACTSSDD